MLIGSRKSMAMFNVFTVACCNAKLLQRHWVFRFFIVLTLLLMPIYMFADLGVGSNGNTPASFLSYIVVYLFNILQVFPIVFLAGNFYGKEQKIDTMDSIYIRPMSNLEYIMGIACGIIMTFVFVGFIVIAEGALINIVGIHKSVNPLMYLFFYFALAFPSLVFIAGLSFFVQGIIRNRGLYIVTVLGVTFITIFFTGTIWQGVFNPFGMTLPGAFSEITGHSDLISFLLQRLSWLLVGLGLFQFSVVLYKRLPNGSDSRKRQRLSAILLMVTGLLGVGTLINNQLIDDGQRRVYADVYGKYSNREKLTLLSQNIEYTQHGSQMEVISRLTVENQNTDPIMEGVIYLNPDLKVLKVEEDGKNIMFVRENQVILIQKEFSPAVPVELVIHYKGSINENIAYLDVPDETVYDNSPNAFNYICFGKRYAFLNSDYTLLIPEILWYPVTVPPVNPLIPYDIEHNFSHYRLTVNNLGNKTAISQGKRIKHDESVTFKGRYPLTGISLIIGEYTTFSIAVDSTEYELSLYKKHDDLFKGYELIQDTLAGVISSYRNKFEYEKGLEYPFDYLRIVETPLTFSSYFRHEHGKSEFLQPEIALLPELGLGYTMHDIKTLKESFSQSQRPISEMDVEVLGLRTMLNTYFNFKYRNGVRSTFDELAKLFSSKKISFDPILNPNPYELTPMFFQYVTLFRSKEYPILNIVLTYLIAEQKQSFPNLRYCIDYLNGNSLKDAFYDNSLNVAFLSDLVKQKTGDLRNQLCLRGIDSEQFKVWIIKYISEHSFQQIEFDKFNDAVKAEFCIDWWDIIPEWYTVDKLPRFDLVNVKAEAVDEMLSGKARVPRYRIEFAVHNDSEADGVISIVSGASFVGETPVIVSFNVDFFEKYIEVKAGESKQIAFLTEYHPQKLSIIMNCSQNRPCGMQLPFSKIKTRDTIQFEKAVSFDVFLPFRGEVIIDDEDPGFTVVDANEWKLRSFLRKNENKSKYGIPQEAFRNKSKWVHIINPSFYGRFVKASTIKVVNNSSAFVEWNSKVDQDGKYELFAYFPNSSIFKQYRFLSGEDLTLLNARNPNEFQHYVVLHTGGEEDISININKQSGWVSLGKFKLNEGQFQIRLLDKGVENQLLYADAVKLVYVDE